MASPELFLEPKPQDDPNLLTYDRLKLLVAENQSVQTVSAVNMESLFGPEGRYFDPRAFQAIHVVRVQTAKGMKEFIRDGNHRSSGLLRFWPSIIERYPDFKPRKENMTDVALNKFYGPDDERPDFLTMEQFWLDNTEHTRKHADIEQQRTMGNLLTGWELRVGTEIAEKYSGFTAVMLATEHTTQASGRSRRETVEEYIARLVAEEPEADILIPALVGLHTVMTTVIDQSVDPRDERRGPRIHYKDLRDEALMLVVQKPEYLGGSDVGIEQLGTLVNHPSLRKKIGTNSATTVQRYIRDAVRKPNNPRALINQYDAIYLALVHPDYGYHDMKAIVTAQNPSSKLLDINERIKVDRKITAFEQSYDRQPITIEKELLAKTGVNAPNSSSVHAVGEVTIEVDALLDTLKGKTDPQSKIARKLLEDRREQVHYAAKRKSGQSSEIRALRDAMTQFREGRIEVPAPSASPTSAPTAPPTRAPEPAPVAKVAASGTTIDLAATVRSLREQRNDALGQVEKLTTRAETAEGKVAALETLVADLTRRLEEGSTPPAAVTEASADPVDIEDLRIRLRAALDRTTEVERTLATERNRHEKVVADLQAQLVRERATTPKDPEIKRLEAEVARLGKLVEFKTTAVTNLTNERDDYKSKLIAQVAENRRLTAEVSSLQDLLEEQTAPEKAPAAVVQVDIFPATHTTPEKLAELGIPLVAQIDRAAQLFFPPLSREWEKEVLPKIRYKDTVGITAIEQSFTPRVDQVSAQTQELSHKWDIDTPEVRLIIGQHYASTLRLSGIDDRVDRILMTGIASFRQRHHLPEDRRYLEVLQILFYTRNAEMRIRCLQFLNSKSKSPQRGERIISDFRTDEGKPRMEALDKIFKRIIIGE